jgi:hypothetical protein
MKNLEEWLEEEHPNILHEYLIYNEIEFRKATDSWEKHLERYGRMNVCPYCARPIPWVQPEKTEDVELYLPCASCTRGGIYVRFENGKPIIQPIIVGGEKSQ